MTLLWGVFEVNYARLEARHPAINLLELSLRRALNLAYELLLESHQFDSEGWERDYAPIFHPEKRDEGLNISYFGGAQALAAAGVMGD